MSRRRCEPSRDAPYYLDRTFRTKLAREASGLTLPEQLSMVRAGDGLLRSECNDLLSQARLTAMQAKVLEKRLNGLTFEDIGTAMGHTKQASMNIFRQAIKKLWRALHVYPYKGLSDVYRKETARGTRRVSYGKIHR